MNKTNESQAGKQAELFEILTLLKKEIDNLNLTSGGISDRVGRIRPIEDLKCKDDSYEYKYTEGILSQLYQQIINLRNLNNNLSRANLTLIELVG